MSKARDIADLGAVTSRLDTVGASDGALSNRNLIINGELIVNQRNNVSGGNVGNATYTYDRWVTVQTLAANTSAGGGYENSPSIRMDATATASGQMALEQRIENPSNFDGLVVTVSAWVKSNSSNCRINIYDFGWNGIKSNAHTGGGGWEFLTATGTLNTGMTDFRVRMGLSDQGSTSITSGDYFEFTQVQLERGDTATPFEHRSYGDELARCQRYYIQGGGGAYADLLGGQGFNITTTLCSMKTYLPVVMRAQPTFSYTGTPRVQNGQAGFALSNLTGGFPSGNEGKLNMFNMTGTSSGLTLYQPMNIDANAGGGFVKLDAEL